MHLTWYFVSNSNLLHLRHIDIYVLQIAGQRGEQHILGGMLQIAFAQLEIEYVVPFFDELAGHGGWFICKFYFYVYKKYLLYFEPGCCFGVIYVLLLNSKLFWAQMRCGESRKLLDAGRSFTRLVHNGCNSEFSKMYVWSLILKVYTKIRIIKLNKYRKNWEIFQIFYIVYKPIMERICFFS